MSFWCVSISSRDTKLPFRACVATTFWSEFVLDSHHFLVTLKHISLAASRTCIRVKPPSILPSKSTIKYALLLHPPLETRLRIHSFSQSIKASQQAWPLQSHHQHCCARSSVPLPQLVSYNRITSNVAPSTPRSNTNQFPNRRPSSPMCRLSLLSSAATCQRTPPNSSPGRNCSRARPWS